MTKISNSIHTQAPPSEVWDSSFQERLAIHHAFEELSLLYTPKKVVHKEPNLLLNRQKLCDIQQSLFVHFDQIKNAFREATKECIDGTKRYQEACDSLEKYCEILEKMCVTFFYQEDRIKELNAHFSEYAITRWVQNFTNDARFVYFVFQNVTGEQLQNMNLESFCAFVGIDMPSMLQELDHSPHPYPEKSDYGYVRAAYHGLHEGLGVDFQNGRSIYLDSDNPDLFTFIEMDC